MSGRSRLMWCVVVFTAFLVASIITILGIAEEINAGKHVALYLISIFAWAPVCALFIAFISTFFVRADFSEQ